jgi:hypothetical protein
MIHDKYAMCLGHAQKELFAQFLARIYLEIPDCKIGEFSTLTGLTGPRSKDFRTFFKASLKKCFVVLANTFDNVKGNFPIGFKIWDTEIKKSFKYIDADVFYNDGKKDGKKRFWAYTDEKYINDWAKTFKKPFDVKDSIATLIGIANDFQQQRTVFLDRPYKKVIASNHNFQVTKDNLIESAIYYTVRRCIPHTWLNHNDQFLWPDDEWKKDKKFQNNCLINVLFNNSIQSQYGTNHWIPFTEKQVAAKEKFESHFMSDFLKKRVQIDPFSKEAQAVLDAGLAFWKYYHAQTRGNKTVSVNASFYDMSQFQNRYRGEKTRETL